MEQNNTDYKNVIIHPKKQSLEVTFVHDNDQILVIYTKMGDTIKMHVKTRSDRDAFVFNNSYSDQVKSMAKLLDAAAEYAKEAAEILEADTY